MSQDKRMHLFENEFPVDLTEWVEDGVWTKDSTGHSINEIYRIQGIKNGQNAYLKIGPRAQSSLYREKSVLEWLHGKLPVPIVFYFKEYVDKEYLLLSEVEGDHALADHFLSNPEQMVKLLAKKKKTQGLKK